MSVKMTRYKQAEFEEDDSSSVGSVQLTEGVSATTTHIRYHTGSSLWKSRTALEKFLLVLLTCLLLLIAVLTILLSVSRSHLILQVPTHHGKKEDHLCLTAPCLKAAVTMVESQNPDVSPCDDFYEYACGRWAKTNPIPDGKSIWGTFGKLEQQNQLVVKNVLEKPPSELLSEAEKKAQMYYKSCMDANETIETLGAKPMLDLLKNVGGWNISGNFDIRKWSLQNTLQILQREYNMGGLFTWDVGEDDRNSSRHIIQIDQGGLTLPTRDNYLNKSANEKVLGAYLDYMTKVGVLLGGEEGSTREQMKAVIQFETELANITSPSEDRRDEEKIYRKMPLHEVQAIAPFIRWQEYFSDAMRPGREINNNEMVGVYAEDYLKSLTKLVEKYNSTDEGKIILNNYLLWQPVRSLTTCLSKSFRDAYRGLRKALIGSDGGEEPWRYCVTDTNNVIGFAIGAMFVREVFQGDKKTRAETMINEVRTAFKKNLKHLSWMDDETRKAAEGKANAITDMIGFPDYILKPKKLDEKYKDLSIDEHAYFQNNINVNLFSLRNNLEKLDKPVNKTRWVMTPPTVNAYYTPTKNQIVFPAGILQAPFYDIDRPSSLNYGGMGVVMGHELTHAFDDQGREYDLHGNLHQWWKSETINTFKNRTDCVVKQYSNYAINNKFLKGKQTLGENIADNGGLKAAYHAYLAWEEKNKAEELPLPLLNLTHRQLFFLSFAQVWCSASTEEETNLHIEKDPHSPPKFRVIGPLSNLPEFSEEFGCPPGSKMNPLEKCEVW